MKLNAEQYGFYRVQYPDELWRRLTLVAARVVDDVPMLPEVEFAGLLDDAWALNEAGGLPIHIFLNLTRYRASYTSRNLTWLRTDLPKFHSVQSPDGRTANGRTLLKALAHALQGSCSQAGWGVSAMADSGTNRGEYEEPARAGGTRRELRGCLQ